MIKDNFVTDMASDAAINANIGEISKDKELNYGIIQRFINLKNKPLAKSINREPGIYVTYDCPKELYNSEKCAAALERYMAKCLSELMGIIKKSQPLFVVGLGNDDVVADSLGSRAVSKIAVNRHLFGTFDIRTQCVCALAAGVYGVTGIQSIEVVKALTDSIKPCGVILIDSLATSTVGRLGTSFQISTTGIAPGSGVQQDKARIDKSVLGVPVLSIGVPLVLSMRTLLSGFIGEYLSEINVDNDEYRLRAKLAEKKLSSLVVAPKEIKSLVDLSSDVIAKAINRAFI